MPDSLPARVAVPLPERDPTGARHNTQRTPEAPPGGGAAEEDELEEEGQHHVHGPHQRHGPRLLRLQRLGEEALTGDAQNGDQNQQPAIATTGGDLPLPEDEDGDDGLYETNNCIVPHREVVVDALPHLTEDDDGKGSSNRSWKGSFGETVIA